MKEGVTHFDIVAYFMIISFCFFSLQHGDLPYTVSCSLTYLSGHIEAFYDFNKNSNLNAVYLPSTYILFALWNIPLKLFGVVKSSTLQDPTLALVLFWNKLLPTLFFFASASIMYRIARTLGLNRNRSYSMMILYISCPILVFGQFILGMYDVFANFFTLIGIYYLLRKKLFHFSLFFGIAMSFKYFPFLIFLPLLLLREKDPRKIMGYVVLMLIPTGLEMLFYSNSFGFRELVLGFEEKNNIFGPGIEIRSGMKLYLFPFVWFFICAASYLKHVKEDKEFFQWSIYFGLLTYSVMFSIVYWHTQWLQLLVPFLVITTYMSKNRKFFLLLDFVAMLILVSYHVITFHHNADQQLWIFGIFGRYNPNLLSPQSRYLMGYLFSYPFTDSIQALQSYFALFASTLLINVIFKFPGIKSQTWNDNNSVCRVKGYWSAARLRFFGGIMVYIIPALLSYMLILYQPRIVSLNLFPSGNHHIIGGIQKKTKLTQTFLSPEADLQGIRLFISTFSRQIKSPYKFILRDANCDIAILEKQLNVSKIKDNAWHDIIFDSLPDSKGKKYCFTIVPIFDKVTTPITIQFSASDIYKEGDTFVNGEQKNEDVVFALIYGST